MVFASKTKYYTKTEGEARPKLKKTIITSILTDLSSKLLTIRQKSRG